MVLWIGLWFCFVMEDGEVDVDDGVWSDVEEFDGILDEEENVGRLFCDGDSLWLCVVDVGDLELVVVVVRLEFGLFFEVCGVVVGR